ncbi:ATP-grasp domain-containing protein [Thalassomonas haliotis]|uniref:ATP-grasp domain-containing protein n=1 Tax=Thalassomonas haliotis TaxID=485448 RepID=A0ABY7VG01_9GAMM|nr:ATP-grasp domain-containing protein [Thalassomonas haliotis]WDE11843.1 ATP-grasp domain-containing protein [Thalassomonas haliotis]
MLNTPKNAMLIIVHQGFSFVEEIAALLNEQEITPCIISSCPQVNERLDIMAGIGDHLCVSNELALKYDDVSRFVDELLADPGLNLLASIATYEGYRLFMAKTNERLVAVDSNAEAISSTLDKYQFRTKLFKAGLSKANSYLLDEETFELCKQSEQKRFIKPRRGAASFSSFPLGDDITWAFIQEQVQQIKSDATFSSSFMDNFDFIAEDMISGQEFSYEVVQLDGEVFIVAIHEKVGLQSTKYSVLETALLSPPICDIDQHWQRAKDYISQALKCLNVTNGVFHIEARYNPETDVLDFIEINPRMGGSLINLSVEILTKKHSMLTLWVKLLSAISDPQKTALKTELLEIESQSELSGLSSYLQIYFADSGKKINRIHQKECDIPPYKFCTHVTDGMLTPDSNREIFAAEGIWSLPRIENSMQLNEITAICEPVFTLEYEQ